MSGISQGSVYALLALGYTMVYGTLGFINFAHGDLLMAGTMLAWVVTGPMYRSGLWDAAPFLSLPIILLVAMSTSTSLSLLLERAVFRPLRSKPRLTLFVASLGASLVIQYSFVHLLGLLTKAFPPVPALDKRWSILGFRIGGTQALILAVTGATLVLLYVVVYRTRPGRAMRAVGQDQEAAALMGVDIDRTIATIFAIAGAMAGVASFVWAVLFGRVFYLTGFLPGLKAFTAAVLGGIGNIGGAVIGGFLLGMLEQLGPSLVLEGLGIDAAWQLKDVFAWFVLIVVLTFRPSGLLGERLPDE